MYLVRNDKRSGGEINSPFFKTRKGLVVNTSKRTYPSAHIITMISRAGLFAYIAFLLVFIGFPKWIPLSINAGVLYFVLLVVHIFGMMASKKAEKAYVSLRNGLLKDFDPAHLYLQIQKYAYALDQAYERIAVARKNGSEEVGELEGKAMKARAEFWTFVNTLRANVVREGTPKDSVKVLYGKSFRDYLNPLQKGREVPWNDFWAPLEESVK